MDDADYPYASRPAAPLPAARLAMQSRAHDEPLDLPQATALSWLLVVVTVFALVDFVLYPMTDVVARRSIVELAMFAAAGLIAAQVAMISAVLVFAPWPLIVRASVCWVVAQALLGCFLGGIAAHQSLSLGNVWSRDPDILRQAAWSALLLLPGALVVVPAPLWLLRLYLGWSLEGPCCEEEPAAHTQPLTIRHYFLAMTTVAAALALVRWHGTAGIDPVEFAAGLGIWVMVGAIGCLATVPVAMLLLLRDRTWPSGLALFTLYMVLLPSLPLEGAIVLNWGSNHWLGAYELAMFYLPFLAWGTGVGVSMAVARLAGYRLRTGARRLHHGQKVCGGPQE